jgi:hypothetical protein
MGTGRMGAAFAVVAVLTGCAAGPKPRVLGTELVAPTTTTPPTTTVEPAPTTAATTTSAPRPRSTTPPTAMATSSTTPVTAPSTTVAPTTTVAGESLEPGTYDEPTDQANSYFVAPDGSTRASAVEAVRRDAPERVDVTVMYYGQTVEVQLTNLAGRTIALPDGYRAAVECRRDGQPWQSGTAEAPGVTAVDSGATASAIVTIPADGPGTYDCTATTTIVVP